MGLVLNGLKIYSEVAFLFMHCLTYTEKKIMLRKVSKLKTKIYCKTKMLLQKLHEPIVCNNILNFLYKQSLQSWIFFSSSLPTQFRLGVVKLFNEQELPQFPQFHISTARVSNDLL